MLFRPRLLRRRARPYQRRLLWVLFVLFVLDAWRTVRSRGPTVRVMTPAATETTAATVTANGAVGGGRRPSVFIVSVHRNTEPILRAAWIDSIVRLVDDLRGPVDGAVGAASAAARPHVFVSAVESGSQDDTKEALRDLEAQLAARGVAHAVDLGATVWEQLDELNAWPPPDAPAAARTGWIWHANEDHYALRRIPYLARVRNQAMAPLHAEAARGRHYDRVLWINDVAFDTADVLTLLDTRGGHYAAACAMDFKTYPRFYDTFALRDATGDKAVSDHWPWFRAADARAAVRAGRPVRVQSCWNGMVVFDAQPFYDTAQAAGQRGSPPQTPRPLLFRGIDDSLAEFHLEASECCLVHADNPQSHFGETPNDVDTDADTRANVGVWVNPNVRVAYSVSVYEKVRRAVFPGPLAAVYGAWVNRWGRAFSRVQFLLEGHTVLGRLRHWRAETPASSPPRNEPGAVCLINEMQIMWQNGWKHL